MSHKLSVIKLTLPVWKSAAVCYPQRSWEQDKSETTQSTKKPRIKS